MASLILSSSCTESSVVPGIMRPDSAIALTLLIVSLFVFFMLEMLPGDVASRILGRDATPETLAALRAATRPQRSGAAALLHWLGGLVTGDLGHSLVSGRPVTDILGPRIANTVLLSLYAFLLYFPLTVIPALLQAIRRDRPLDHALFGDDAGPAVDAGFPARDHPSLHLRHDGARCARHLAGGSDLHRAGIMSGRRPCRR